MQQFIKTHEGILLNLASLATIVQYGPIIEAHGCVSRQPVDCDPIAVLHETVLADIEDTDKAADDASVQAAAVYRELCLAIRDGIRLIDMAALETAVRERESNRLAGTF
jgi:hypothetical protein